MDRKPDKDAQLSRRGHALAPLTPTTWDGTRDVDCDASRNYDDTSFGRRSASLFSVSLDFVSWS
nr:uncharacterized protein CTRU02_08973 [Colletotrichum truncatum]KAF6789181.1 hypothetical protein CTRU02_08973 [Colletotrichum truncatum]